MAMDLAGGDIREIAPDWERSVGGGVLADDGKTIYTTTSDMGEHALFAIDVASGEAKKLVGDGTISSFEIDGPTLAFSRNSMKTGNQLITTGMDVAQLRAITHSAGEMVPEAKFRSEEHTSEHQSLMRQPYAVLCFKTKKHTEHEQL